MSDDSKVLKRIRTIVEEHGKYTFTAVPDVLLKLFPGDGRKANMVAYLLRCAEYPKVKKKDGWFFQSWANWEKNVGIKRTSAERIGKELEADGLCQIRIERQTHYYRLNIEELERRIESYLASRAADCHQTDGQQCTNTLRESLARHSRGGGLQETTNAYLQEPTDKFVESSKTTIKTSSNTSFYKDSCKALSFDEWCSVAHVKGDIRFIVRTFLNKYKEYKGHEHPPLRAEVWRDIAQKLPNCEDTLNRTHPCDPSDYESIVPAYFQTTYQDGCDYRLPHFASPRIRANLMFHERRL